MLRSEIRSPVRPRQRRGLLWTGGRISIAGAGTGNEKARKSSSIMPAVVCGLNSDMKYAYGDYLAGFYL